jgi:hypothetical protein
VDLNLCAEEDLYPLTTAWNRHLCQQLQEKVDGCGGRIRFMALTLTNTFPGDPYVDGYGQEIWPVEVLDEAVRQALAVYSQVFPACVKLCTPRGGRP